MAEPFPKEERDALLARAAERWARLYPRDAPPPDEPERVRLRESYYQGLAEYADRLPRRVLGASPFTGEPLLRSFDPFGFDGWWWHVDVPVEIQEPRPPQGFQVLLGALTLKRPAPAEAVKPVMPGPDVPFVVPALMALPGMQVVVSRVELPSGDIAWPISYWSPEEIPPQKLHQPWCRNTFWFTLPSGQVGWSIANHPWDFDLRKWAQAGKLAWADVATVPPAVRRDDLEFLYDMPGDRRPQLFQQGRRILLPLPDGTTVIPFGEPEEGEPPPLTPEEDKLLESDED